MSNKNSKTQSGQCGGAIRMPAEYFGQNSGRYFADGAPELATPSCQRPASFGTIFADGTVGPVLRTQTGGKRRMTQSKSKKYTRRMSKKLSLKAMRKKLSRMTKRLSNSVKRMSKNVKLSL
jgi:hypothetical protein